MEQSHKTIAVRVAMEEYRRLERCQLLDGKRRMEGGGMPHMSQSSFVRAALRFYCSHLEEVMK